MAILSRIVPPEPDISNEALLEAQTGDVPSRFSSFTRKIREFIGLWHYMGIGLYGGPVGGLILYVWLGCKGYLYYVPWILYTIWMIYDRNTPSRGGRPNNFFRGTFVWRFVCEYFPMTLVKTCDLPTERNYVFGCHPHGFLTFGTLAVLGGNGNGFTESFSGIRTSLATFKPLFYFPFFRDYLLANNTISVEKKSLEHVLTNCGTGNAACVVVGGTKELLEARPGSTKTVLKTRKGFVEVALKTGSDLVPVYVFGENELFTQLHHVKRFEWLKPVMLRMIKVCGFPLLLPTWVVPARTPLYTVIGSPIHVQKIENPTAEEIDELHATYMSELEKLFEDNKLSCGFDENTKLEFI